MRLLLLISLWLVLANPAVAQPKTIDSLRNQLGKAKADTSRIQLIIALGYSYLYFNSDSALSCAKKGLQLASKINYQKGEMDSQLLLANALLERDIPQSMRIALTLLQKAQQVNNRLLIRECNKTISLSFFILENYPQAIIYQKRVKLLALEDKDKPSAAVSSQELGIIYHLLQQADSARYYLTLAAREYPPLKQEPFYLYYWGMLEEKDNPVKARTYFQQGIQGLKNQHDTRGLSLAYRRYSDFLWKYHQPDSSILMAKNGLQAGQLSGNFRTILYNSRVLTNYYHTLGRPDSAYKYQYVMTAARDSLFSQQKINQIQMTLIADQQRVQRLQEEKSDYENRTKLYGLLGLLAVLVIIAGILYRNDHQQQKTNRQLQTLNHEVTEQKEEIQTQRDHLEQTLTELQTTQAQLIQKEKLASLGELTAGIAHEIQNPLNFVNNFSEVSAELIEELEEELDKGETDEVKAIVRDIRQNLHKITQHGQRASGIVKGMLEHSRSSTGEVQPTDLNALCDEYLRLAYHGQRAKDKDFSCELVTHLDTSIGQVNLIAQEMGRVLLNLYTNAFYAVRERQKQGSTDYHPTVTVSTAKTKSGIEIRVDDNGTGMADSVQQKIFQPFFTTKPTGEGTGLGLSLSYDIVTKGHQGSLQVQSQVGQGTEFIVQLPSPLS